MGWAVKVTGDPAQIVDGVEVRVMLTGRLGLTVIVMTLEVSGLFIMHPVIEEVRIHLTTSLFSGIYEKDAELIPALMPFTCH